MQREIAARPDHDGGWALILATSAVAVMRTKVGCGFLSTKRLILGAGANVIGPYAAYLGYFGGQLNFNVVLIISLAVCARGFWLQRKHWREVNGARSEAHSWESGKSHLLEVLPLPQGFVHCVIDPLVFIGAGWIVMGHLCGPIGAWMIFCGALFAFFECGAHYRRKQELIQTHDTFRDGERQRRMADHVAPSFDATARPAQGETAATGIDDDIEWHLSRRDS